MPSCHICNKNLSSSLSRHWRIAHELTEEAIAELVQRRKSSGGSAGTAAQQLQRAFAASRGGSAGSEAQQNQRLEAKRAAASAGGSAGTEAQNSQRAVAASRGGSAGTEAQLRQRLEAKRSAAFLGGSVGSPAQREQRKRAAPAGGLVGSPAQKKQRIDRASCGGRAGTAAQRKQRQRVAPRGGSARSQAQRKQWEAFLASAKSRQKTQNVLCPLIPMDGSQAHGPGWVPPYTKRDIAKWIADGMTAVCCVCNSWQQRRSCPVITESCRESLAGAIMDRLEEEPDEVVEGLWLQVYAELWAL